MDLARHDDEPNELAYKEAQQVWVLSMPAGESYSLIIEHGIYACPARYSFQRSFKHITFRQRGGIMSAIYAIEGTYELNRFDPDPFWRVAFRHREMVRNYAKKMSKYRSLWADEDFRFYVLSGESIELLHQPRVQPNPQGIRYFSMAQLTSGTILLR